MRVIIAVALTLAASSGIAAEPSSARGSSKDLSQGIENHLARLQSLCIAREKLSRIEAKIEDGRKRVDDLKQEMDGARSLSSGASFDELSRWRREKNELVNETLPRLEKEAVRQRRRVAAMEKRHKEETERLLLYGEDLVPAIEERIAGSSPDSERRDMLQTLLDRLQCPVQ